MTDTEMRIAMAGACGWKYWHNEQETLLLRPDENWPALPSWKKIGMEPGRGASEVSDVSSLPDYLNDLNAMHAAVQIMPPLVRARFQRRLNERATNAGVLVCDLTARDWAEEFMAEPQPWKSYE